MVYVSYVETGIRIQFLLLGMESMRNALFATPVYQIIQLNMKFCAQNELFFIFQQFFLVK